MSRIVKAVVRKIDAILVNIDKLSFENWVCRVKFCANCVGDLYNSLDSGKVYFKKLDWNYEEVLENLEKYRNLVMRKKNESRGLDFEEYLEDEISELKEFLLFLKREFMKN